MSMLAILPAAFGRLCVETLVSYEGLSFAVEPAAFGRLCVETSCYCRIYDKAKDQPPSGGCVLKRLILVAYF